MPSKPAVSDKSGGTLIYCRISLDKSGEELGVERQERECRDYCEKMGWPIAGVLTDNDISATRGKVRPAFESLLMSNPERIVVWHTDRLVRLTADLERVIDLGVNVHALHAGHLDLSNPAGRAVARTVTAWATYEGEQKSERQKSQQRQRASSGEPFWAHRPFGYERDGSALREDEADALRQTYMELLEGVSIAELARRLNAKGFLTVRGNPWIAQTLRPVLRNARNAGILVYRGDEVGPGNWPAIVSEEVYRATERSFKKRKSQPAGPRRNLLTGWAVCGVCGVGLRAGRKVNKGGSEYLMYFCSDRGHVAIERAFLEGYVLRKAIGKLNASEAVEWTGASTEAVDVSGLVAEERAVSERLASLGAAFTEGLIDMSALTEGTRAGRVRLDELREAIGTAGEGAAEMVDVELIYQAADSMDADKLRTLLQRVVGDVTVLPRGKGNRATPSKFVRLSYTDGTTEAIA